jgi:hypothetical protein
VATPLVLFFVNMENKEQTEDVGQTKSGPTMPNYVHRDTRAPISSEQEVQDGAAVVARTAEVEQEGQRHGQWRLLHGSLPDNPPGSARATGDTAATRSTAQIRPGASGSGTRLTAEVSCRRHQGTHPQKERVFGHMVSSGY